jgi:hypothetical protein
MTMNSSVPQQIEDILRHAIHLQADARLSVIRSLYHRQSQQFDSIGVSPREPQRMQFEESILHSLQAITETLAPRKTSSSGFSRHASMYRSLCVATSIST